MSGTARSVVANLGIGYEVEVEFRTDGTVYVRFPDRNLRAMPQGRFRWGVVRNRRPGTTFRFVPTHEPAARTSVEGETRQQERGKKPES